MEPPNVNVLSVFDVNLVSIRSDVFKIDSADVAPVTKILFVSVVLTAPVKLAVFSIALANLVANTSLVLGIFTV